MHAVRGRARETIIAWILELASGPNDKLRANLFRQCVGRPWSMGQADLETFTILRAALPTAAEADRSDRSDLSL